MKLKQKHKMAYSRPTLEYIDLQSTVLCSSIIEGTVNTGGFADGNNYENGMV